MIKVILSQITATETINMIEEEIVAVEDEYNQEYAEFFSRFYDQVTDINEKIILGVR